MLGTVTFTPIGVARTPFHDRMSAPRQPYAAGGVWTDEFFARIQKEAVGDYMVEMRIRENEERCDCGFLHFLTSCGEEKLSPGVVSLNVHFLEKWGVHWDE